MFNSLVPIMPLFGTKVIYKTKKPPSGGRDGSPLRSKSAILVALLPIGEVSRSDGGGWTYLHEKGVHNCEPLSRGDGRTLDIV